MSDALPAHSPLRHFSFPLNVYARLLELEDGFVEYMHYGLFDGLDGSAAQAQRQASELLWQHLPAPCRLLDVGVGLGTTLSRLTEAGYAVTGLTPDQGQIDFIRERHGAGVRAVCSRYEDFAEGRGLGGGEGEWDAILFQESAQYINAVDLFDRADRLLRAHGEIVVMDEFLLCRDASTVGHLHDLEHFLRLAERAGFVVTTRLDLSARAAPTVDWLLAAVERHAATLQAELGVTPGQLEQLNASNRAYQSQYRAGRFGYVLLRLQRTEAPRWHLGRIDVPERQREMQDLFRRVFGQDMSPAHWQWKYADGRGLGVGVWRQESGTPPQLVAHYGGMVRDIVWNGQAQRALQCGDVMVDADGRGSLSRRGPVFLSAATCLEQAIGYGTGQRIAFGFPNERAYRLPERLGLYGDSGRMLELSWPALSVRPSLRLTLRELNLDDEAAVRAVDACWAHMRDELAGPDGLIVGVRDAAYLRHRYQQHPSCTYRLFALQRRWGGRLLGALVLRQQGERCELLDWVAPLRWQLPLIHHARRLAAAWGARELFAWGSDGLLARLDGVGGALVRDINVMIPGNAWTPGPAPADLAGRWWLTGGDTDFH